MVDFASFRFWVRMGMTRGEMQHTFVISLVHVKGDKHISQDSASGLLENVHVRHDFPSDDVSSGELEYGESVDPKSVPTKPRPSRCLFVGRSSVSEVISSISSTSRRSRTSLARSSREATVTELSSSSCPL